MKHHFARSLGMSIAAALVRGEDLVIAKLRRAAAGNLADGVKNAGFEVDQGADDVKSENLEIAECHGGFFSGAGAVLVTDVHSGSFGTMIVSSGWRVTVRQPPIGGMRR